MKSLVNCAFLDVLRGSEVVGTEIGVQSAADHTIAAGLSGRSRAIMILADCGGSAEVKF